MLCGQKHPSSQFWLSHTGSSPRRRAHVFSQGWPHGLYTSPLSHIIAAIKNKKFRFSLIFYFVPANILWSHVKDPLVHPLLQVTTKLADAKFVSTQQDVWRTSFIYWQEDTSIISTAFLFEMWKFLLEMLFKRIRIQSCKGFWSSVWLIVQAVVEARSSMEWLW